MIVLYVILTIYCVGSMFTLCGSIYGLSALIAERGFSRISVANILIVSLAILAIVIFWPWLLFRVSSFRQDVIDVGRIVVIFGYVASALFTPIYPWVWAWYLGGVLAWYLLTLYHKRISPITEPS